ncbi:MAG: hypothetical protein WAZ14_00960 [Patescibacteria group bacterium]
MTLNNSSSVTFLSAAELRLRCENELQKAEENLSRLEFEQMEADEKLYVATQDLSDHRADELALMNEIKNLKEAISANRCRSAQQIETMLSDKEELKMAEARLVSATATRRTAAEEKIKAYNLLLAASAATRAAERRVKAAMFNSRRAGMEFGTDTRAGAPTARRAAKAAKAEKDRAMRSQMKGKK